MEEAALSLTEKPLVRKKRKESCWLCCLSTVITMWQNVYEEIMMKYKFYAMIAELIPVSYNILRSAQSCTTATWPEMGGGSKKNNKKVHPVLENKYDINRWICHVLQSLKWYSALIAAFFTHNEDNYLFIKYLTFKRVVRLHVTNEFQVTQPFLKVNVYSS